MPNTPPTTLGAPQTWTREGSEFFISNDPALISVKAVNDAFGSKFLYWAKPFPEDVLRQLLDASMCFGVYKKIHPSQPHQELELLSPQNTEQIGLARMVTDGATFGYLSDTYVLPEYQGKGLGRWLVECVAEVFSKQNMPFLRRIILLSSGKRMQDFYNQTLGMKVVGHEERPDLGRDLVFMCARPQAQS